MNTRHATGNQIHATESVPSSWTKCLRGEKPGVSILLIAQTSHEPFNGTKIIRRLNGIKSFKLTSGTLLCHCFDDGVSLADLAEFEKKHGVFDIIIELKPTPFHFSHLPQVTTTLADSKMQDIAHEFGAPVLINKTQSPTRLRAALRNPKAKWLAYELGQSAHTNALSVWAGVKGLLNVMTYLGMIDCELSRVGITEPFVAYCNQWVHARTSGIIHENGKIALNAIVEAGQTLATIEDLENGLKHPIVAPMSGMIIGKQNSRSVDVNSPLFHIASIAKAVTPQQNIARINQDYYPKTSGEVFPLQVPFIF